MKRTLPHGTGCQRAAGGRRAIFANGSPGATPRPTLLAPGTRRTPGTRWRAAIASTPPACPGWARSPARQPGPGATSAQSPALSLIDSTVPGQFLAGHVTFVSRR
jgi:hypothetical protein